MTEAAIGRVLRWRATPCCWSLFCADLRQRLFQVALTGSPPLIAPGAPLVMLHLCSVMDELFYDSMRAMNGRSDCDLARRGRRGRRPPRGRRGGRAGAAPAAWRRRRRRLGHPVAPPGARWVDRLLVIAGRLRQRASLACEVAGRARHGVRAGDSMSLGGERRRSSASPCSCSERDGWFWCWSGRHACECRSGRGERAADRSDVVTGRPAPTRSGTRPRPSPGWLAAQRRALGATTGSRRGGVRPTVAAATPSAPTLLALLTASRSRPRSAAGCSPTGADRPPALGRRDAGGVTAVCRPTTSPSRCCGGRSSCWAGLLARRCSAARSALLDTPSRAARPCRSRR